MEVKDLINLFSTREDVPIDVQDDVAPVVKEATGVQLWFWPTEINTEVLRGKLVHWSYPDGGKDQEVIDIYYASKLPIEWARVVCCKELIHILDPIDCRVMTDADVEKLIDKIVLPRELQDISDGEAVWNDRFAVVHALAVLFPWATRALLKEKYDNNEISSAEIAELVDLPESYVRVVMRDSWAKTHHLITA